MRSLILLLLLAGAARAAEPVDMALVLVSDVSRSVDDSEFQMEKSGYAAAFNDPRVLAAIRGGAVGAIAVAYVEFAGTGTWCATPPPPGSSPTPWTASRAPSGGAPASAPGSTGRCGCCRRTGMSRSAG